MQQGWTRSDVSYVRAIYLIRKMIQFSADLSVYNAKRRLFVWSLLLLRSFKGPQGYAPLQNLVSIQYQVHTGPDSNTDTDMFYLGKKLVVWPQWPSNTLRFFTHSRNSSNALLYFWDNAHAHFDHATTTNTTHEQSPNLSVDDVKAAVFGQNSTDTNFGVGTTDIRLDLSSCTVLTESGLAQSGLFQTQVYYCDTEDSF